MLNEGDPAPDVTLQMMDGSMVPLSTLQRPLVVYFYPKDDTSGCTAEAKDFSALAAAFAAEGVALIGISRNSPKDHAKFTAKYELTVPLATDADGSVTEAFGVWIQKSMYGRKYMGIERATFLLDADGNIAKAWRKVSVPGHAAEVLDAARALKGNTPS
ncbi:peroxiredoxin [Sphingomonas nostoxanthinifaciens]|uniref:peroxiredoxin n=1 Tax=Sphingomonas nostoxanthinifaciens TaxID=2872652 RepID=UPI001CC1D8DB|nr:peroxiredoxin [Sphingomonas nostoxanthinifaciens]UAK24248.1 peroxiredoxin [Sphingomonas nostoxanthinifaciens]